MDFGKFLDDQGSENGDTPNSRIRATDEDLRRRLEHYQQRDPTFEVTDEHFEAMKAIFQAHSNVFLTGGAGTGKTTFIRSVVLPELDIRNLQWAVTALTGIAGSHLDGKTIHSFLGIQRGVEWEETYPRKLADYMDGVSVGRLTPHPQDMDPEEIEAWYRMTFDQWMNDPKVRPATRQGILRRLRPHEVLVVDEISMAGGCGLLGYIDFLLREVRGRPDRSFGGLQLVMVGDFCQLPPVQTRDGGNHPDWAFMSPTWDKARVKAVELTKVFRQGDPRFIQFLNDVRVGKLSAEDRAYAANFVRNDMTREEIRLYPFLVPTNRKAKRINAEALADYPEPTYPLEAEFFYEPDLQKMYPWEVRNETRVKKQLTDVIDPIEKTTFVRIGTPVMFTVNDPDGKYVNGTLGLVKEVNLYARTKDDPADRDNVVVRVPTLDPEADDREVVLYRRTYSRSREQDPYAMVVVPHGFKSHSGLPLPREIPRYPTLRHFPLRPATAITIHKCVDKSTIIPTSRGMERIGSICESGSMPRVSGRVSYEESSEPFVGGVESGYRITTRRGYSEVCSVRHPLLRVSSRGEEWVKTPKLRVGDMLRMRGATHSYGDGSLPAGYERPPKYRDADLDYKLPEELSENLAWLLGALVGDGCVSDQRDHRLDITSMDWCVLERFADIMKAEFGLIATLKPKPSSRARVSYVHCVGVRKWLLWLGLSHATAPDKSVPDFILRGSREQQAAFLRGYFDADGGVNTAVHVTSSSRQLIGEVHLMLLNMGIVGTIADMTARSWRINITGVDIMKFRDRVGFSIPHKAEACDKLAPDSRKIPKVQCGFYPRPLGKIIAGDLRVELREVYPGRRDGEIGMGDMQHWAHYLSRVVHGSARLSDVHLAALGRDLPDACDAGPVSRKVFAEAAAGCFLDEIVSIEKVEGDMRDICVENGHAFVGNGFVNHNSQGMSMDRAILSLAASFAAGQVYVGLSRLRGPKGMVLENANFEVKTDPYVMDYYQTFRKEDSHGVPSGC